MTRLTFGLPVFNGERFLPAAVASLQAQTLADIRIVISDNGSSDGTEDYCRAAAAADSRIDYRRSPVNNGAIWNFREVSRLCNTELFSWMAADDVKLPDFASETVAVLDEAGPAAVFACPRTELIDADGFVYETLNDADLGMDADSAHERVGNMLRSQASHAMYGVIRTAALRRTRDAVECGGTDVVLLAELLCQGKMVLAPGRSFQQRHHDEQASMREVADPSWFATRERRKRRFRETRTNVELYRAVGHSRLPLPEVVKTTAAVTTNWVLPRWRAMARDLASALGVDPGTGRLDWQRSMQAAGRSR